MKFKDPNTREAQEITFGNDNPNIVCEGMEINLDMSDEDEAAWKMIKGVYIKELKMEPNVYLTPKERAIFTARVKLIRRVLAFRAYCNSKGYSLETE